MNANSKQITHAFKRKGLLVFAGIGLSIGLMYGVLQACDNRSAAADGLIGGFAYRNIIGLVGTGWLVSVLLYLGLSSRRKIIQNIALSLSMTALLLLLLETGAHVLMRLARFSSTSTEFRRYYIDPSIANRPPCSGAASARIRGAGGCPGPVTH